MQLTIDLPEDITLGDLTTARGAIVDASTRYVDWEALYNRETGDSRFVVDPISAPGRVLLAVAHQLDAVEASV